MNVLAILPGLIPSTIIGIAKPLERLAAKGEISLRVQTTGTASVKDVSESDVVVFCRNSEYIDLEFLYAAKRAGKYVVYDIDDNFFNIPTNSALGIYHRWSPRLFVITEFFRLADKIRTYSKPIYDEAKKYNDNVLIVKSYFDFDIIDHLVPPPREQDRAVRICYQTSRGPHDTMMGLFTQPLNRVIFENPGKIEFHFWGKEYPPINDRNAVKLHKFEKNYNKFVKECYLSQFDIGLAPAGTDLFSQSKTNNKYREYGAMGVAGIYTKMPVYEECVQDGVNGLLVENNEASWRDAIERLIKDPELRQRIIENAREDVRANYNLDSTVQGWREILADAGMPRYGAVPPEPQQDRMNVFVFYCNDTGLDPWINPIREVCAFMRADLSVQSIEKFHELYRSPRDAVIIVGSKLRPIIDAAWAVKHTPKRLFLVYAAGTETRMPVSGEHAIVADAPVLRTYSKEKRGPAQVRRKLEERHHDIVTLDDMALVMGHVTVVTNDVDLVGELKAPTLLVGDVSPLSDVMGNGLARFWIEALSQTPIRKREGWLSIRVNHRLAALSERRALLRINLRRPFKR